MSSEKGTIDRHSESKAGLGIKEALRDVLSSSPFHSSKQCQELLEYLVTNSVQHPEKSLKERVIGAEVFGRRADYDTAGDPIVRARVGEVRKRLAQYYQSGESSNARLLISIPSGTYRATFTQRQPDPSAAIEPVELSLAPTPALAPPAFAEIKVAPAVYDQAGGRPSRGGPQRRWFALSLSLAAVCVAVATLTIHVLSRSIVDRFWAPVLHGSQPVLIYTGANPVFLSTSQFLQATQRPTARSGPNRGIEGYLRRLEPGQTLSANDVIPVNDDFVTVGDMSASVSVVSLLSVRHRSFDLRSAEDISFGDLRKSPAVLIGAFNNFWTLQMTEGLSFTFQNENKIREAGGTGRTWSVSTSPDSSRTEDYALVSRLITSRSGNAIISLAGITHCGTRAAAEFATSSEALGKLAANAPKDWLGKNMQVLLHTDIVNGNPGPATIVGVHYW